MKYAIVSIIILLSTPAYASRHPENYHEKKHHVRIHVDSTIPVQNVLESVYGKSVGPKPNKWCGWFARVHFGGGPEYNVAKNWANRGKATSPKVGAIVVWKHHVGWISGKTETGEWIITSGNDGNKVRTRVRSVAKAIAFREL